MDHFLVVTAAVLVPLLALLGGARGGDLAMPSAGGPAMAGLAAATAAVSPATGEPGPQPGDAQSSVRLAGDIVEVEAIPRTAR